jgi:hypothetical protein
MPNFEYFSISLINNIKMASFIWIKDAICLQTELYINLYIAILFFTNLQNLS